MKWCYLCKETKPLDEFHKNARAKDGKQSKCKECNKTTSKRWQAENADKHEAYWRGRDADKELRKWTDFKKRARKYGLSTNELATLLQSSGGVCQICKQQPHRWLVVDHCHNSLAVRGVLCEACNQALGLFKDNILSLQNAIEYLNKNGGVL